MAKSRRLIDEALEVPKDPAALPDNEQVALIRRLDQRQRKLAGQLKTERAARQQAEKEIAATHDLEELMHATSSQVAIRRYEQRRKRGPSGSAEILLCATDWHCEERIEAATIGGLNEFNLKVADRRIDKCFKNFLRLTDLVAGFCRLKAVNLWFGGDQINGYIHQELQEGNFLGPAEAVLWVQDRMATGIQRLLDETKLPVVVLFSRGNHGRSTSKKPISTDWKTSWEYLLAHNVANYFRNEPRVSFKIEIDYFNTIELAGNLVYCHHGDAIKYQGGVGGITIPVNKAIAAWRRSRRQGYHVFGHWHQWLHTPDFLAVNCLCGYSPYAQWIKAPYSDPAQAVAVFDRQYGNTMALPVYV